MYALQLKSLFAINTPERDSIGGGSRSKLYHLSPLTHCIFPANFKWKYLSPLLPPPTHLSNHALWRWSLLLNEWKYSEIILSKRSYTNFAHLLIAVGDLDWSRDCFFWWRRRNIVVNLMMMLISVNYLDKYFKFSGKESIFVWTNVLICLIWLAVVVVVFWHHLSIDWWHCYPTVTCLYSSSKFYQIFECKARLMMGNFSHYSHSMFWCIEEEHRIPINKNSTWNILIVYRFIVVMVSPKSPSKFNALAINCFAARLSLY